MGFKKPRPDWPGGCLQTVRVHQRKGPVLFTSTLSGVGEGECWGCQGLKRSAACDPVSGRINITVAVGSVVVAAEAGRCSRRCIHARFFLVGSSAPHDQGGL
jgi:hypothetical protein